MSPAALTVDVHVAPMRPFAGAPGQGPGDDPMWSPMSSTLIAGAEEGILVDALVTLDQVDALAEWVRGFCKGPRHPLELTESVPGCRDRGRIPRSSR